MRTLNDAIQVITQPPGDLVYYLVALFALQQAFVSAVSARSVRAHASLARRWAWVSGGLLLARALLVGVGLAGVAGFVVPSSVVPPLERWLVFATGVGLIWTGLLDTRFDRWRTPSMRVLVIGLLIGALGFCAFHAFAPSPASAFFTPTGGAVMAELAVIVVVLVVAICLAAYIRPLEWEWGLGVAVFWLIGAVLEIGWRDPMTPVDGWLRLFSLVALPLLSIWVHRQLLPAVPTSAETAQRLSVARPLIEILQNVGASRDLESSLIVASSRLASLLDVDVCVVTLASREAKGALRVTAIHPPTAAQVAPPQLSLAAYVGLRQAFDERQIVVASSPEDDVWLRPLYTALGFETVLPLAILPLYHAGRVLGLLLLGGLHGVSEWRSSDLTTPVFVSDQLAGAIASAQSVAVALAAGAEARPDGDAATPSVEAGEAGEPDRQRLLQALEQAKVQFQALNKRIRRLMQEIKSRDQEILALNKELESRGPAISETELSIWQSEVRQMADDREQLDRRIQDLTEERDLLLDERTRLDTELKASRSTLEEVEAHRDRLEEAVASLNEQLEAVQAEPPGQAQEMPADRTSLTEMPDILASHSGDVGLMIADEDGQIMMADAVARRMLRLPEGDVAGLPIDGAFADPRWSGAIDDLLTRTESVGTSRVHLTLSPDEDTVVEADLASLQGRDGDVDGLIITLRSSESEAERYEALVSLASDFRTPMTAITGYTDLLLGEQGGILTEMQQQFLERVKANVEQLAHHLNDLIRIASPDSRPLELSPQPVSLIEIIEEAIMGLAARFRERKLAVELDLPPELSLVRADRDSLYQIMLRLLSNAVLCSKEGSQIVVSAHEVSHADDGRHVQISVVDTGAGIQPADYPRVFRKFYRASQPLIQGLGETGVGMAMAKTLVEANGGRIWVESEEGEGSTFSFILPCETSADE